jgi:hypothetical protein
MSAAGELSFERLDARPTVYRFDLERDVPWQRLGEPGRFFPDSLLRALGLDVDALAREPGASELCQWALALATAEAFVHLERDVIRFVGEAGAARPSRSAELFVEEEEKHTRLFRRLADHLRAARPDDAALFDQGFEPPHAYDGLRAHAGELQNDGELFFLFWLNTIFFEEYTVWLHHALDAAAEELQPAWLAAHLCHRREEVQHVLTDAAYLEELALDPERQARLSKAFFLFLDRSVDG